MARFVLAATATVPAGTPQAAPVTVDLSFDEWIVEAITVVIPPGPNGLSGFRLANAGVAIIPYRSTNWIIGNDEVIEWVLSGQITSGSWQLIGYNTGDFDHTFYFRFLVSEVIGAGGTPAGPTDLSALTAGGVGFAGTGGGETSSSSSPAPAETLLQEVNAAPVPGPFVGAPPLAPPRGGL